jgi:ElaB/YqjD/DUF883 family membrane-anchored ribosome-binding protein
MDGVKDQVEAKAGELRGEASFRVREQVAQRSTELGEHTEAFAHALRSSAQQLRAEGKASSAELADRGAQRVDSLGRYLRSADADRIVDDIESFARRRPWLTAGVGALAGFLASRFVKASSDRRYAVTRGNGRSGSYPAAGGV